MVREDGNEGLSLSFGILTSPPVDGAEVEV